MPDKMKNSSKHSKQSAEKRHAHSEVITAEVPVISGGKGEDSPPTTPPNPSQPRAQNKNAKHQGGKQR